MQFLIFLQQSQIKLLDLQHLNGTGRRHPLYLTDDVGALL
jgi:hypothetical protein